MNKVRVAVNGYGVIGKRVADAVRKQEDMELIGVADIVTDYRIKTAVMLGLSRATLRKKMQRHGLL